MSLSSDSDDETARLLDRLEQGDRESLGHLLALHRPYLRRIVELRMGDDLRERVDPSDIVQESQLVVLRRIDDFLKRKPVAFRVWLRGKVLEQIVDTRRHHLAAKRSMHKQFRLSDESSLSFVRNWSTDRPSQIVGRKEAASLIQAAIARMGELDREILLLRHVEELNNKEAAEVLDIDPATARKRHGRAIRRLGEILGEMDLRQV